MGNVDAVWRLSRDQNEVVLRVENAVVDCDALSIWEAEYEERPCIFNYKVRKPSEDLPQIQFNRLASEPVLIVRGNSKDGFQLKLAVKAGGVFFDLPTLFTDQIVIADATWMFVNLTQVGGVINELKLAGIKLYSNINLGQLVWLRARDFLGVEFEDVSFDSEMYHSQFELLSDFGLSCNVSLFNYQKTGVTFLSLIANESIGCILADEMGLGKTLQVVSLFSIETREDRGPNLVVCPATLVENWRREILSFAPQLKPYIHAGGKRTGDYRGFKNFDVVIVSYETAVRDELILSSVSWNVVAIDEAQNIKNPMALRTVSLKKIPRRVSIAMTGTPMENKLTDLWSIADFALPGILGTLKNFQARYDDNECDAQDLSSIITPIMLRRRVSEVATDLPHRIDIPQILVMSSQMAEDYEKLRQETIADYGANGKLVVLSKLRQFCTHPLVAGVSWGDPAKGMPKYQRLLEVLEEIFLLNEKVLIFSSFTGFTDLLMVDLPKRFPSVWSGYIDGRVAIDLRQNLVDEFSEFTGPAFFSLNPKAAGVGLNITAANHVIHFNPEWNPAVEDQASARAYRRKQKRPVTVHHLYFSDSVEELVMERLMRKRSLANEAVVGHEGQLDTADIERALKLTPFTTGESEI